MFLNCFTDDFFASLLSCWTSWPGALTFLSALQLWLAVLLPESFSQLYVPVYLSRLSISWLYLWCLRALFYVLWMFLFHSLLFLFYRWGVFFFFLKIGWYILKFFSSPRLLFLLSAYFGFILCGRCFLYWAFNPWLSAHELKSESHTEPVGRTFQLWASWDWNLGGGYHFWGTSKVSVFRCCF